jgi:amino acid adenylation domain-containing protein
MRLMKGNTALMAGERCQPDDPREFPPLDLKGAGPVAGSSSLTARFAEVALAHGGDLAVITRDEAWTYEELALRAGRITALLQERCGPESEPVALLFRHEASMIAAILGTLGAGKFYVPLVAEDPPERLRTILGESGCITLLAGPGLEEQARQLDPALLVLGARDAPASPAAPAPRSPDAISYLLYTSGTTGQPKGVYQSDGNVLHHAACYAAAIGLAPADRMTLFSAYSFDAAVMDIFATLMTGATLCIWDIRRDGFERLQPWMMLHGVTIWHSTPSVLRVAFPMFREPARLRWVVLGGEAATGQDLKLTLLHAGAGCRLLNGLGPTECTTALQYVADPIRDCDAHRLPVGRPVAGAEVVLLDPSGRVTDGQGELAIRSRRVALGYWRRPDLTAERFVASPDGGEERIYRTGDMARWTPDGHLEYLGRLDDQVKIRGYRVELSEIQAAICRHDDVVQAVVLAKEGPGPGQKRLVAYVVVREPEAFEGGRLRAHLARRIPDYMMPQAFVPLARLPLLPNGKVDRRALPEPERRFEAGSYVAPRTPLEGLLAQIWSDVLCLEKVGVEDNFFEIGGDSLEGTRVISRIRTHLEIDLQLRALFDAPTVSGLARLLTVSAH